MNSYENQRLMPMPTPKPYAEMTDKELQHFLSGNRNLNQLIPALIEANIRKDKQIADLTKRLSVLETKTNKSAGRKRKIFYLDGNELTDADIVYYIDNDYFTFTELERLVGAKKNQLRNRYKRIKN